ncbi:MAG: hypothetical protein WA071_14600 [Undibacterium umbellatum]|uniref:hypothetical protein n=1 Tax=Undibacterium umbellatum TaxID=2762300 RepID=UPI003BB75C01
MNNFFSPTRFGRLLRAHWAEKWREYAWFVAVLVMLDLIFMAIFFSSDRHTLLRQFQFVGQMQWYLTGLFFSGIIFAGRYFKYLLNPGASLVALMRPASVFEKWLMAFLVISVFYPLAYTLLYMLLNYPAVQVAKAMAFQVGSCESCNYDFRVYFPLLTKQLAEVSSKDARMFMTGQVFFFVILSTAQAFIASGTAYFKRSPVLRTLLVLFLLFIISIWTETLPQLGIFALNFDEVQTYSTSEYGLSLALWLGLPALLWAALYFHIKEREVA